MTSLTNRAYLLCALLSAGAPLWPGMKAAAQDCTGDADCGAGYRCQTDSYESCSGEITCTPDGECTEIEDECETVSYAWCTNALCTVDADCPSTMACHAQTTWECSGGMAGASAGGTGGAVDAGVYEESTCVEVPADSVCIPRHQLPCTVASDCGGGFDCVQSTYWECSGGGAGGMGGDADGGTAPQAGAGGAVAADAGASTPVDADGGVDYPGGDYECHEVPSAEQYCSLQDLPCTADAECPEGLSCLNRYVWTCDGGGSAGSGTGTGGAAAAGAGGGTPRPPTAPSMDADGGTSDGPTCEAVAQQRCMPREYDGGATPPGSGGMTGGGDSGSSDGGVSDPGPGGFAGSGSAGVGGAGGASAPGESGGSSDEDDDDHGHGLFGWLRRGCSAGGPISSDPVGWLALGLTALVLRRRARRLD
jgi:uncharacterized protein (TIGR03382 family)